MFFQCTVSIYVCCELEKDTTVSVTCFGIHFLENFHQDRWKYLHKLFKGPKTLYPLQGSCSMATVLWNQH